MFGNTLGADAMIGASDYKGGSGAINISAAADSAAPLAVFKHTLLCS